MLLDDDGKLYLFYHGRDYGTNGTANDVRTMRVCEIAADNGKLTVVKR